MRNHLLIDPVHQESANARSRLNRPDQQDCSATQNQGQASRPSEAARHRFSPWPPLDISVRRSRVALETLLLNHLVDQVNRCVALAIFAFCLPSTALAARWVEVDERTSYNSRETRYIDTDTVRKSNQDVVYRIRLSIDWSGTKRTIERTVVADCENRRRFEVVSSEDWSERPFKSVFDGTSISREVEMACQLVASQAPAKPAPHPLQPEASPSPLPQPESQPPRRVSTGSGFAVAPRLLLTNYHVVDGCVSLTVRHQGRELAATVYATNQGSDLALIETPQSVGNSSPIRHSAALGEEVMVAGYPLAGLLSTDIVVTSGQVNSMAGIRNDPSLLQISAPVQPGNSGGPLIDRSGNIV